MRQKKKKPLSSFSVGHILLGMRPTLKWGLNSKWDLIEENWFFFSPCMWLSVGDSFFVMDRRMCSFTVLDTRTPMHLECVQVLYILPESRWVGENEAIHSCCVLKTLLPWCHPSFLPPLLHISRIPESLVKTSHGGMSVLNSFGL